MLYCIIQLLDFMLSTPLYTDQPCLSKGFNNDPNNSYNSNMPKQRIILL